MATLNVAYINPFIVAVGALFGTVLRSEALLGTPRLMMHAHDLDPYEHSVEVRLKGAADGKAVMCFSVPVALAAASALAGVGMTRVDRDCRDALGRFAGMIAGKAVKGLAGAGQVEMSLSPVLATSEVRFARGTPVLLLPFDSRWARSSSALRPAAARPDRGPVLTPISGDSPIAPYLSISMIARFPTLEPPGDGARPRGR